MTPAEAATLESRLEVRFASLESRLLDEIRELRGTVETLSDRVSDGRCPAPGRCLILQEMIDSDRRSCAELRSWRGDTDKRLGALEQVRWKLVGAFGVISMAGAILGPVIVDYIKQLLHVSS